MALGHRDKEFRCCWPESQCPTKSFVTSVLSSVLVEFVNVTQRIACFSTEQFIPHSDFAAIRLAVFLKRPRFDETILGPSATNQAPHFLTSNFKPLSKRLHVGDPRRMKLIASPLAFDVALTNLKTYLGCKRAFPKYSGERLPRKRGRAISHTNSKDLGRNRLRQSGHESTYERSPIVAHRARYVLAYTNYARAPAQLSP